MILCYQGICTPLLKKLRADLLRNKEGVDGGGCGREDEVSSKQ